MDFYNKDGLLMVVHGGAKGFDTQVSRVAKRLGIKELVYLPEWNKYGKSAGNRRNKQIVDASDYLYALYDGRESGGTFNAINYALEKGKSVYYLDIMRDWQAAKETAYEHKEPEKVIRPQSNLFE